MKNNNTPNNNINREQESNIDSQETHSKLSKSAIENTVNKEIDNKSNEITKLKDAEKKYWEESNKRHTDHLDAFKNGDIDKMKEIEAMNNDNPQVMPPNYSSHLYDTVETIVPDDDIRRDRYDELNSKFHSNNRKVNYEMNSGNYGIDSSGNPKMNKDFLSFAFIGAGMTGFSVMATEALNNVANSSIIPHNISSLIFNAYGAMGIAGIGYAIKAGIDSIKNYKFNKAESKKYNALKELREFEQRRMYSFENKNEKIRKGEVARYAHLRFLEQNGYLKSSEKQTTMRESKQVIDTINGQPA